MFGKRVNKLRFILRLLEPSGFRYNFYYMVQNKSKWHKWFMWSAILVGLYFATRLFNLTKLPIFTDEAIYIRWSQIGSQDASWRFISLTDGKQPLFTWIMMVLLRVFDDPLFTGRFVSVISGFVSMIGLWFLTRLLFKNVTTAFLASTFYILSPFTLMYDRMALYDSLSGAIAIWTLYFAILLIRSVRLDIALILSMTLGLGMLNKSSGFLSLYLLPTTIIMYDYTKKDTIPRFFKLIGYMGISIVLSLLFYSILRLSPYFHIIQQKNLVFVYSFSEWLTHPFQFTWGNLKGLFDWLIGYLTKPLYFVVILQFIVFWRYFREKAIIFLWWFVPFIGLAAFGRVLYPRFILLMTIPLFPLIALTLSWIIKRWHNTLFLVAVLCILLIPSIWMSYFIIIDPLHAPIPYADKGQYIDNWPSGWGVREVNELLLAESQNGKVTVYTDGTFGLLPYAIEIYLVDKPNIEIVGIWPLPPFPPQMVIDDVLDHSTYLVLNQTTEAPQWPLELVAEYQKGNRTDRTLRLYRVLTPLAYIL